MKNKNIFKTKTIIGDDLYQYVKFDWNIKRSGDDFLIAFFEGSMSGIVILTETTKKEFFI